VDENPPPLLPSDAKVVPQAHKLRDADSFRDHFEAVTRLQGITLGDAKKTCTWGWAEYVDFQFLPDVDWVVKERSDAEIDFRRKEWQEYVRSGMIPYGIVKDKFEGRGIVILAGNQDTLMRLKVILRQLVKLQSTIAIEVHYWDDEMTEASQKELSAMYQHISFNDLSKGHNIIKVKKDGYWINYQLKTAALINSKFAEPLLLDSDNVPVIDPATLYDSKAYQEYHTVFWPDIARTRPQNPAWAITNTPGRMTEYAQESGQLLVDKRRYWYHLQLASWLNNEHGDYYNKFLLGDKDMFRFSWHALRTDYGRPRKWLTSVGTENDGFYCGHSFAQHHPDTDQIAFMHGGLFKAVSLEVMRWNRETKGAYFRNYKRSPTDENPGMNINVAIKFDGAAYYPNHTETFKAAMCTDMYDVEAKNLEEILPGWEARFEEIGGYWQLDEEKAKVKAEQDKAEKANAANPGVKPADAAAPAKE
jgi:alpha 1,2-mannosyltransferase